MPYFVGVALALGLVVFARAARFDRDRAFYPTVLIVVAAYYPLFGAMSDSPVAVLVESLVTVAFAVVAVTGFRTSLWVVVAGLAGHGVFDALHGHLVPNPGVPRWWPAFCLVFDVAAAAGLAWFLRRGAPAARMASSS